MSFSEEAIKDARDRVQDLLENQCRIPVRATTPISFYYKTSDNLVEEADHFYRHNELERSFILYSRYITYVSSEGIIKKIRRRNFYFRLFVQELKLHHPFFATVSVADRERVKEVTFYF
jgi:hypothetical protein